MPKVNCLSCLPNTETTAPLQSFIGNFIHTVISPPQNFKNYVARIFEEYWWGKEVKPHSPHRFLRRFSKASGVFQLPDSVKESLKKELSEGDEALEKRRIVANLLGLCVMASVSYAQGQ